MTRIHKSGSFGLSYMQFFIFYRSEKMCDGYNSRAYSINLNDFFTEGKGVRISKAKYDVIKLAIIECLKEKKLTHLELTKCINEKL